MRLKVTLHIPTSIFTIEVEVSEDTNYTYIGEHIANTFQASLLYTEEVEENEDKDLFYKWYNSYLDNGYQTQAFVENMYAAWKAAKER